MAFTHSPKIVTDGLVYYLDGANVKSIRSGSNTVYNVLNSSDTGSSFGTVTYSSQNMGGLRIVDFGSGITIPTPLSSSRITYEVLVKGARYGDYGFWVQNNSTGEFVGNAYMSIIADNTTPPTIGAYINGNNRSAMNTGVTASSDGIYHICLVVSGTQQTNYVNGIPYKSSSIGTTSNYDSLTYLGGVSGSIRCMSGSLYVFRVYNRPLTDQEIQQNFNALRGRYGI